MKYEDIVLYTKRDIRNLNDDDIFKLYKKLTVEYDNIKDYLINGEVIMSKESYLNIRSYVYDTINNISVEPTKVYELNLEKIHSYNDLFELILSSGKKVVNYNEKYLKYVSEILSGLNNIDDDLNIKRMLKNRFLKIEVDFIINYTQKDLDNISKPFIDTLFKYGNTSDNKIKVLRMYNVYKNKIDNSEKILFKITPLTLDEIEESSLMNERLKQI